jgi:putative DNA primase/helicase
MNNITFSKAAQQFTTKHIPVLPVCAIVDDKPLCGNPNCPGSKHPLTILVPHAIKDSTTDEAAIKLWDTKFPNANIGIATGAVSNLVVLDIDPKNGGDKTFKELIEKHGKLPETPCVKTGSGGQHFYFKYPIHPVKNRTNLFQGIDVKSDGGYVVAAPSRHASGNYYEWTTSFDVPLAEMPDWLLDSLLETSKPAAITAATGEVIAEGSRNSTLTSIAGKLRRQGFTFEVLKASLLAINDQQCSPTLPPNEVVAIAKAVSQYDVAEFARIAPATDAGNAELFAHQHSQTVRFDHKKSTWLIWKNHWWVPDAQRQVLLLAKDAARARQLALDEHSGKSACKFALASESKARLDAMISMAKAEAPISDSGDGWDADPYLTGTPNGVLALHTGHLRSGAPEDKITKSTNVEFDPNAPCPRWELFLNEIFNGNTELIDFIRRAVGYSLTGSTAEQVMFMCYGKGANGKSVFFSTLKEVLGAYAFKAPSLLFDVDKCSSIPNDVAALDGKRFVILTEMGESSRLNESRIKELVHGDEITARFLNKEFFTFTPVAKYWIAVNHKPKVRDESDGFWRSIQMIPFTVQFSGDKADKDLTKKLCAEAAGILAWAVRGCLEYQKEGLKPPILVAEATAEYREESDVLNDFFHDACITAPNQFIPAHLLYMAYATWAGGQGLTQKETLTSKTFGMLIKRRFRCQRIPKGNVYWGIGLATEENGEKANPFDDPSVMKAFTETSAKQEGTTMEDADWGTSV